MSNVPDPMLQRRKLTDAELQQLASVTPADIDAAVAAFNQHAPASARGLLEARQEDASRKA